MANLDFFFWSGLYGEPFLFKDILYYFDGETLTIAGYPLNLPCSNSDFILEINDLLYTWATDPSVKNINYFGTAMVKIQKSISQYFERVYLLLPDTNNEDVTIDLTDPLLLKTSHAKESLRAVKHRGLLVTKTKRQFLTHHHITLIR
jgi:hypothetical protein